MVALSWGQNQVSGLCTFSLASTLPWLPWLCLNWGWILGTAATALSGELFITETQDKSRDKFPPAFIYLGSNPIMGLKEKKKKKENLFES